MVFSCLYNACMRFSIDIMCLRWLPNVVIFWYCFLAGLMFLNYVLIIQCFCVYAFSQFLFMILNLNLCCIYMCFKKCSPCVLFVVWFSNYLSCCVYVVFSMFIMWLCCSHLFMCLCCFSNLYHAFMCFIHCYYVVMWFPQCVCCCYIVVSMCTLLWNCFLIV